MGTKVLISKDGFKEMLTSKSSSNVILSSTLIMKKRFGISISKSLKGKEVDALPLIEPNSDFAATFQVLD